MFQTFLGGRISSSFRTLIAVALFLTAISHYADALTPRERSFAFEYETVVKDIPAGAKQLELWLPVPHNDLGSRRHLLRLRSPARQLHRLSRDIHRLLSLVGYPGALRHRIPAAGGPRGRADQRLSLLGGVLRERPGVSAG
jgi:hypothetical protein